MTLVNMYIYITVRQRTTFRPSSEAHSDASHSDHFSQGDVMQVSMSGHLLLDPRLTQNDDDLLLETDNNQLRRTFVMEEEDEGNPLEAPGPGSSLEQYFDRQFHTFPMSRLPAVDWSMKSFQV